MSNHTIPLLKVSKLTKSYPTVDDKKNYLTILKDLDFEVFSGETVAILGASGSGKSSLLHVLAGIDSFDSGEVYFDEKSIVSYSEREIARWRNQDLGFIYQFHFLIKELSILDNVALPGMLSNLPRKQIYARAEYLLESVQLSHRLAHKPNQISGGERQRVALARALMNKPKLILADEPTGSLDEETSEHVQSLLLSIVQEFEATLLVVTHNKSFANLLQRKYMLTSGKLESMHAEI